MEYILKKKFFFEKIKEITKKKYKIRSFLYTLCMNDG